MKKRNVIRRKRATKKVYQDLALVTLLLLATLTLPYLGSVEKALSHF